MESYRYALMILVKSNPTRAQRVVGSTRWPNIRHVERTSKNRILLHLDNMKGAEGGLPSRFSERNRENANDSVSLHHFDHVTTPDDSEVKLRRFLLFLRKGRI
jgi:hypothetical protein